MDDLIILDIFWDRRLVRDASGKEREIFRGVDYDTDWEKLGQGYSKDKQQIYQYAEPCFQKHIKTLDIPSFSLLAANSSGNTIYFQDKNHVYLKSYMCDFSILAGASPHNFQIIEIEKGYASSGEQEYWYDELLPYSLAEMTPLNDSYQKVGSSIYFGHTRLMEADAATFEIVHSKVRTLARDKDHLYFKNEIVEGAHPASFHLLEGCVGDEAKPYLANDIHFYAKDERYAYFVNEPFGIKVIKTKDLDNFRFEVIDNIGYGRDSNYRYEKGKRRKLDQA